MIDYKNIGFKKYFVWKKILKLNKYEFKILKILLLINNNLLIKP
jgi:hypothetical protein